MTKADKLQEAATLGEAYAAGLVSSEGARNALVGFNRNQQLHFQTSLFKAAGEHIGNPEKIPETLEPFKGILKREALEVFTGWIRTVDTSANVAPSILNGVFNKDVRLCNEPFERTKLQKAGVVVVEHSKFDYTIYQTPSKKIGVQIVPDNSRVKNVL